MKNKQLSLSPSFSNIKNTKEFQNYVEETMESETYDSSANDDISVFERFVPD